MGSTDPAPRFTYRVAVIDMFYPGDEAFASEAARRSSMVRCGAWDIDLDGVGEPYYHGDLVALFMDHPAISVVPYPVRNLAGSKLEIVEHLQTIRRQVLLGEPLDALLLPWESSTLISSFGEDLRVYNAAACQKRLRAWSEKWPSWKQSYDIIRALEAVADLGVLVFTIAGNCGPRMINTYSLAEGVITVGSATVDPDRAWIADNVFVDTLAPSTYQVRLVVARDGTPF
jgi:hypothetical protein